jgi:hypothetical protein
MHTIQVSKIRNMRNSIIIKRDPDDSSFMITTNDSMIITVQSLSQLLHYLIIHEYISPKILEGILEDYYARKNG